MRLLALAVLAVAVVILVVGWRATAHHPSHPRPATNYTPGY